ncbi:hypothetical protein ACFQI7_25210 [Paenibacillus allorhizosphaerae]|uniref:Uncharacterized protein n=1 Tax=Paenibacillus allorhizosphaerae TaxID=2849866 RepID=A0ABN7TPJ4_9BACL|nr:hypothetical protein [Paenibacillus allorhizosphaerae]CAG7645056.1 hypothetical protein PAECIP111802_03418 [Paenibacillus allorhizosphaerae]
MTLGECEKVRKVREGAFMNSHISLFKTGYTLMQSNNPEYLGGQQLKQQAVADEGLYLYRDTVTGRVRVFLYHYNNTKFPVKLAVAVRNPGKSAVHLYVNRTGISVHSQSIMAGTLAWHGWLTNAPNGQDTYASTLRAGGSMHMLESQLVQVNETVCGVVDFFGVSNHGFFAPLEITVYAFAERIAPRLAAAKPDPYYQQLPDRPEDDPCFRGQYVPYGEPCFEASVRGTFPSCSRYALVPWNASGGHRYMELFNRHSSPRAIRGEFEPGIDATTNKKVYVANYGVDYTLQFLFADEGHKESLDGYFQNPYDSWQYFILSEDGDARYCGAFSKEEAWHFRKLQLAESRLHQLWTTIPGGFSGKQQIVWK